MLEPLWGTSTWRPETSGNICSFSQNVSSSCQTWKQSHRYFSQHIGYSELENIRRIDHLETIPMSRIVKKLSFFKTIFKTKQSTELKTGQQIYVKKCLLSDEGENSKFLILVFFLTSRGNQEYTLLHYCTSRHRDYFSCCTCITKPVICILHWLPCILSILWAFHSEVFSLKPFETLYEWKYL